MIEKLLKRSVVTAAVLVPALLSVPNSAEACGGFFCSASTLPINQAAERIIFADNGDGTVTAVIQILYQGPAQNFSWLLPITTVPSAGQSIGVASNLAFQRLQSATNPRYTLTTQVEGTCGNDGRFGGGAGAGGSSTVSVPAASADAAGSNGGVTVEASGTVGAFDWTAISFDPTLADPSQAAVTWLESNGYLVSPGAPGLLRPYLESGLYLLALKLTKGSDTGSIRPLMLTYAASKPMIPIKLTAVAANDDMGVMTWLLSSARGVPKNYLELELNEARINWFNPASNYNDVVTAAADEAAGHGFVTEFAGPPTTFGQAVWGSFDESQWVSFKSRLFSSFQQIFDASYGQWGSWDGFWDAVKVAVTLPAGVPFDDFKTCPACYSNAIQFSPTAYRDALEANVIQPVKAVQNLLDAHPYVTRLYTTMSAAEMTEDPLFTFNKDLADVSNVHTATRFIECNPNVTQSQAPWRIELPQGGVVRGTAAQVGSWPGAFANQPANTRIMELAETGQGAVLEDNVAKISAKLDAYNAGLNGASADAGVDGTSNDSTTKLSSGCAIALGGSPSRFAALGALVALGLVRRRRAVARAPRA